MPETFARKDPHSRPAGAGYGGALGGDNHRPDGRRSEGRVYMSRSPKAISPDFIGGAMGLNEMDDGLGNALCSACLGPGGQRSREEG